MSLSGGRKWPLRRCGGVHRVEGLQLGLGIDAGIHLGGLRAGVTEPEGDLAYIMCALKSDDRAGVSQNVGETRFSSRDG